MKFRVKISGDLELEIRTHKFLFIFSTNFVFPIQAHRFNEYMSEGGDSLFI